MGASGSNSSAGAGELHDEDTARTGHTEGTHTLAKATRALTAGVPQPRPLNGYILTSQFRKLRTRWNFTHLEAHLFLELMALSTEGGWPTQFSAKNAALTAALGCSEKGLIKARKTLAEAGLLTYLEGQNRRPTSYRFCPVKGLPEVSVSPTPDPAEHLPKYLPEVSVSPKHLPEYLPEYLPEVSPYKEVIKIEINPSGGVGVGASVLPSTEQLAGAPSAVLEVALTQSVVSPKPVGKKARQPKEAATCLAELLPVDNPLADLLNPGGLYSRVQQLREPLTDTQAKKLLSEYTTKAIEDILAAMANRPNLLSGNLSANLTARRWLGKPPNSPPAPSSTTASAGQPAEELDQDFIDQQQAAAAQKQAAHLARYSAPLELITLQP